jgi:hypothetical protein
MTRVVRSAPQYPAINPLTGADVTFEHWSYHCATLTVQEELFEDVFQFHDI